MHATDGLTIIVLADSTAMQRRLGRFHALLLFHSYKEESTSTGSRDLVTRHLARSVRSFGSKRVLLRIYARGLTNVRVRRDGLLVETIVDHKSEKAPFVSISSNSHLFQLVCVHAALPHVSD